MCCNSSSQSGHSHNCGCQAESCLSPMLWSRKKQVQYVKDSITCLQSRVKDLQDKLAELEKGN